MDGLRQNDACERSELCFRHHWQSIQRGYFLVSFVISSEEPIQMEVVSARGKKTVGAMGGSGETQLEVERRKIDKNKA